MKNKLSDLNDHLFAQLERLADEDLKPEEIEREVKRGDAMVAVADTIIRNGALQLASAKLIADHGAAIGRHLPQLMEPRAINGEGKPS